MKTLRVFLADRVNSLEKMNIDVDIKSLTFEMESEKCKLPGTLNGQYIFYVEFTDGRKILESYSEEYINKRVAQLNEKCQTSR